MSSKTYRVSSMQEALALIRADLGPEAAVLDAQEVPRGLWGRWFGARQIDVTASDSAEVPSRLDRLLGAVGEAKAAATIIQAPKIPAAHEQDYREIFRRNLKLQFAEDNAAGDDAFQSSTQPAVEMPPPLFELFTELVAAEIDEEIAREIVQRLMAGGAESHFHSRAALRSQATQMVCDDIRIAGPIALTPGRCRVVALVGPTGVGKTTTIAKLAANFRLRDRRSVGLITVDTFRVAAVDQLRTYADIMDLPMEVVTTPHEMRQAIDRLQHLDLVLIDTAGRSPRDDVKTRSLESMLTEAGADEVHLVLSAASSAKNSRDAVRRFAPAGVSAIVLTKLDEATGLGGVLGLLRDSQTPLSYLTDGQNVPSDIESADAKKLARAILEGHLP